MSNINLNRKIKIKIKTEIQINKMKHVKGEAYLVFVDGRKYLLKLKKKSRFILEKWKNNIFFKKELLVNQKILKISFNYFNFPKLISTDKKTYMLFEYIEGSQGIKKRHVSDNLLADSLLEFNMLLFKKDEENILNIYENFFSSSSFSILKGIILFGLPNCGILLCLKILIILLKHSIRESSCKYPLLQHGDLGNITNKISGRDGKIYFIDFASIKEENKWILTDIVDMAISRETFKANCDLFNSYLAKLYMKTKKKINIKAQVRIALIRKTLYLMNKKGGKYKQNSKRFLLQTLVNDCCFNKWFEKNLTC